ncbi:PLP-dependent transferase [Aquincola sp. S2]|uniref:PLP-dependent transferase n=1 Tax=Pseudaquabacterium terrae TaxID=2732868 RepID=A0ABX2ETY4_9BURK|nr:PLP-dependent aspartate aminotransferase family protein [Aquabacterium terrae]NRF71889.1 PLP-dependent transferase [Aquabacterium terrae]
MHTDTALVHLGRETAAAAVNPPIVRASTIVFDRLAAYKQAQHGRLFDAPRYGRSGTATTFELQRTMAALEGTEACIATASGLAALTAVLAAHAGPGRHLLLCAGLYGPARTYAETELARAGTLIETFAHDEDITHRLRSTTSLVCVETPASLTMQMLDLRAICAAASARGIPVACDSTWGTPVFFRPHALGISLSIHAATKFIGGHSDGLLGLITGTHDAMAPVRSYCDRSGTHATPDACWMALRGLRTLAVRMRRHQETALAVAHWLQTRPEVRRVLYPALESDPGHALWRQQFSGAGGPFSIELQPCSEAQFARLVDGLQLFSLGTSWGGFESLVLPAVPHHLRGLTTLPDEGRLVRLHVGLEDAGDLCDDLAQAFAQM